MTPAATSGSWWQNLGQKVLELPASAFNDAQGQKGSLAGLARLHAAGRGEGRAARWFSPPSHQCKTWPPPAPGQPGAPDRFELACKGLPSTPLYAQITDAACRSCLRALQNGKAVGRDDGIPNEVLKHMPPQLEHLMFAIIRLCWRTAYVPAAWLRSDTLLFLKRSPSDNPGNYRPIAIHKTLLKLYTRVVSQVLSNNAEHHGLFGHAQEGFRPRRGT